MIAIDPVRVFPETAVAIRFSAITLVPFDMAFAQWELLNADGVVLCSGRAEMTHEQYLAWGVEDTYAEDCFLGNLGLIRSVS